MNKLTPTQLEFLSDAVRYHGRVAYNGHQKRTGESLASKGLVTLPALFGLTAHHVAAAHATDAGRAALVPKDKP